MRWGSEIEDEEENNIFAAFAPKAASAERESRSPILVQKCAPFKTSLHQILVISVVNFSQRSFQSIFQRTKFCTRIALQRRFLFPPGGVRSSSDQARRRRRLAACWLRLRVRTRLKGYGKDCLSRLYFVPITTSKSNDVLF